jgi:hypothetical protein
MAITAGIGFQSSNQAAKKVMLITLANARNKDAQLTRSIGTGGILSNVGAQAGRDRTILQFFEKAT